MAGRDNTLETLDEQSSGKPGGNKESDDSKHSHNGLFDSTDHLVSVSMNYSLYSFTIHSIHTVFESFFFINSS